jgi:hypothetical protein
VALDLALIVSIMIVALAVVWGLLRIAKAIRSSHADISRDRALGLLALFAPAVAAAERDPRTIVIWQTLARSARALFSEEFAMLDRASGATFPFSDDRLEDAHARWTADWLAWERTHDADYKLKAAVFEQELAAGSTPLARARLEAVEREKLDMYQRRYEEYIRVSKALQALSS